MNREILFKGFHPDENGFEKVFVNGKWIKGIWVEGAYMPHYYSSRYGKISAIFVNDDVEGKTYRYSVIPETVGQYIGRADKNKKIFVGDIVKSCDNPPQSFIIKCGKNYIGYEYYFANLDGTIYKCFMPYALKIIGNIHSNPELLEVSEQ